MILSIETSLKNGSISIFDEEKELGFRNFAKTDSMSQDLLSGIDDLILQIGIKKSDLSLIAVSNGPGSLTGIRVGISVGMGLAFALGIKCVGLSLLEALRLLTEQKNVITIVPGSRGQSCWQLFEDNRRGTINVIKNEEFQELLREYPQSIFVVENSLSGILSDYDIKSQILVSDTNPAALIAKKALLTKENGELSNPTPIYI